jgi:cysteine desulfurase family protein
MRQRVAPSLHGKDSVMIYLDNAATTMPKPPEVISAVAEAMQGLGNAARGSHGGSMQAARMLYDTRVKVAKLFGCVRADHVAFTANATEALNVAISGAIPHGAHVIATDLEHNSVLRPLYRLEAEGRASLGFVPADCLGNVDVDALARLIGPKTRAIVCTHASNLTGNLIDIARVGALARSRRLLFIVDASQTAGQLPIDMEAMNIDIMCFTGHKGLFGPQGTGGLCVREGVEIAPLSVGGSGFHSFDHMPPQDYPERLEAGTRNAHGIAGLSAALDILAQKGLPAIERIEAALMRRFYEGVRAMEGVRIYGDFSATQRAPIVALNIRDEDSGQVADALSETYGIATRAGAHCAPRMHEALHTAGQGAVRFSFSWQNTEAEIDAAIRAIRELAK